MVAAQHRRPLLGQAAHMEDVLRATHVQHGGLVIDLVRVRIRVTVSVGVRIGVRVTVSVGVRIGVRVNVWVRVRIGGHVRIMVRVSVDGADQMIQY